MKVRILIADSSSLTRLGLVAAISKQSDFEIVAGAENVGQAIDHILTKHPDVVVMDINLPPEGALTVVKEVHATWYDCRFLILATSPTDKHILALMRAGVLGCIVKDVDEEGLLKAIRDVAAGQSPISPIIMRELLSYLGDRKGKIETSVFDEIPLTRRQYRVLRLIAEGLSNKVIGHQLNISERTVEAHVRNLLKKMKASNRTQALILATRNGWLVDKLSDSTYYITHN